MTKESVKDYLISWTITYLKSRDAVTRTMESVDRQKEGADIIVNYKDSSQLAIVVEPFLTGMSFIDRLKPFTEKKVKTRLVTANTRDNLKFITANWKPISEFSREFNIIFVNPFSKLERKWMLYPQTHAGIAGKGFERGLKALFATVEPISEKEFEKLVKGD